jgi:hypothetical protein
MPFALDSDPSQSEISDAINYLLANYGGSVSADPGTGQITGPQGIVSGYLYKYMAIKYADSRDGSLNFSSSPTGRSYYGLSNSDSSAESTNPADYIWYQATGGFGTTKFLWYLSTGGRQIQFAVATTAPDTAWLVDPGSAIDLDVVTSGNIPVIAETFTSYFAPGILFVPRSGSPLTPSFTGITPSLYATNGGNVIPYSGATLDTSASFVNNSWRIGNSPTTGLGDITYTNITIGNPTDAGDYAIWPNPTAMTGTAYIDVPIRFKDSLGNVTQASVARIQLSFADPGVNGYNGPQVDFSGFTGFSVNNSNVFTPSTATLSAIAANVTSPTYSWSITGATPSTSTSSSVVITPLSTATSITVSLTVNGSNLTSSVTTTKTMPVTFDGVPGTAGSNGVQSAFPSIYIWTGSSAVPTRPSTTSTYTWSTGAYTAPSGWYTSAPSNTTTGNYLWQITIPLNVTATTTTSTLDWTNTAYPIRCIAYNGTNGANASILALSATAQTFTYDGTNSPLPASQTITFTAGLQNLTGTATFTCNLYDSSGTNIGSVTLGGSGNVRTLTDTQFGAASYAVVNASLSGYSDTMTVARLQDGANGTNGVASVTGILTNEAASVAATSSGTVPSFAGAGGNFYVYDGITDVTTSCTFSVASSSGVTVSITSGGVYTVTAMSASQGSATLRAVYGSLTIDKIYNISKSVAGVDGSNASVLTLVSTAQTFTYDGTGTANPASQTISFTANTQNLPGTATFSCNLYNSTGTNIGSVTMGGSGNTRTLTVVQFSSASYAVVTASLSGFSDTITIVRLQNGATGASGTNGTNGVSPIVGLLTNEAVTLQASSTGTVVSFVPGNGNFLVYQGTTDVTSLATFSVYVSSGVTVSITSGGAYSITGMSSNYGTATFRAVYGGVTIDKVYTVAKSIAGVDGLTASLLFLSTTAQTFTYDGSGNASPTTQTINFTANFQNLSGTATFTCNLYNSSGSNIGTVTMGGSGNTRSLTDAQFAGAAYATVAASLSGFSDTMTVVRIQNGATGATGSAGQNAVVGLLTNEAVTVAADSSGNVSSFAGAGGTFQVYYGLTEVTSSATFTVYSSSNVTISINSSGVYSVTAMSANQGSAVLQATYGTTNIQKVYNISKSLAGTNGSNGSTGATGSAGSATFLVTRTANDSSAPSNAEVTAVIGRNPVAGDIVTVSYNNGNNAVVYRFTTSWITQATYLTGGLIVDGTITGQKIAANSIWTQNLQVGSSPAVSGTTMIGSGAAINNDGTFALGNASTNATFNGTTFKLNGNVVNTDNISLSAVTFTNNFYDGSGQYVSTTSDTIVFKGNINTGTTSPIAITVNAGFNAFATGSACTYLEANIYYSTVSYAVGTTTSGKALTAIGRCIVDMATGTLYIHNMYFTGYANLYGSIYFYVSMRSDVTGIDVEDRSLTITGYKR